MFALDLINNNLLTPSPNTKTVLKFQCSTLKCCDLNQNTDLSYKGVMFSLHFLIKIVLGFLLVENNFIDYFGYYKNYFGSTG